MMKINIDYSLLLSILFVSLRLGAILLFSPIFSNLKTTTTVRVLFIVGLSITFTLGLGLKPPSTTPNLGAIILASLSEVMIGAILAFGVFAAFGAFSVAGKILDIQSGFGLGYIYDPVTAAGSPIFATMLNLVAVAVFFGLDAHLALFRGLAFSLHELPPGGGLSEISAEAVIKQFGLMFTLGVALIVPVMLCLLMSEVALTVVSRVLPQMNIFVVGIPVKIFIGLSVLALIIGAAAPNMARIYSSIFSFWGQVFN
jgi:flagellar biosynthesis protein FliR